MQTLPALTTILSLIGTYVLLLGASYLLGYWGPFRFEAFHYVGVGDLVRYAIYPCFLVAILLSLSWALGPLIRLIPPRVSSRVLSYGGMFALAVAVIATLWRERSSPKRMAKTRLPILSWMLALILSFMFVVVTLAIAKVDYVKDLVPSETIRYTVVGLVVFIPSAVFYFARISAWSAKEGRGTLFVDLSGSALSLLSVEPDHLVTYLRCLGDFFVLYEVQADRLIIVRTDKLDSLALVRKTPKMISVGEVSEKS